MPFLKISEEIQAKLLAQLQTPEMLDFVAKTVASEDSGRFKMVISTQDEDRQGEIIDQNGWDLSRYMLNPVVLWAHDYTQLPLGITEKIYRENGNLIAEGKFAPGDCNPFAQQVRKLYDLGMVRTASVGLIGKQAKGNTITKSELLEWSFVPVPANPFALKLDAIKENGIDLEMVRSKGMEIVTDEEKEPDETVEMEEKGMTEDVLENATKLRDEKYDYVDPMFYAWWDFLDAFFLDSTPIEAIGTLTDELCAKYKAIASGQGTGDTPEMDEEMKALSGAILGLAIKRGLAKGKLSADKLTESEAKAVEMAEVMSLKAGKVLSEKNRTLIQTSVEQIKTCAAALQELLDATSEQGDGAKADDAAAQKQRSNPEGSALLKDLDDYFAVRRVLRSINNITSDSLAKINKSLKK